MTARRTSLSLAKRASASFVLLLSLAGGASAQSGVSCRERPVSGEIGISQLLCVGRSCRVNDKDVQGEYFHTFSVEPAIGALKAGFSDALRVGDVIVAVDGFPITTKRGGYALANLVAGRSTQLRVRRQDNELVVDVVPKLGCNMPSLSVRIPKGRR